MGQNAVPVGQPEGRRGSTWKLKPRVPYLAPVVGADRARLGAVGERHQEIGRLRVTVARSAPRDLHAITDAAAEAIAAALWTLPDILALFRQRTGKAVPS
jgi:hypothetical protein